LKSPRVLIGALAALVASSASAQTTPVSITDGLYLQNFNTMGTEVSPGTYPTGWNGYKITGNPSGATAGTFINSGSSPALIADDGSVNDGSIHNYGTNGSTDRSLGSMADPITTAGFGVVLVNNTGRVLTAADIQIAFRAEQWRTGGQANINEVWTFEYRTGDATLDMNGLSSTGWTQVSALNLNEIQTSTSGGGPIDGNAAGNFVNISGALTGLVWNPGDRLVLRWLDANNLGADAGMSIDDFSFNVVPEPGTFIMCGAVVALAGLRRWRRRRPAD